jgi:hypothetical protein
MTLVQFCGRLADEGFSHEVGMVNDNDFFYPPEMNGIVVRQEAGMHHGPSALRLLKGPVFGEE